MPLVIDYITVEELKASLNIKTDTTDADVAQAISAASRAIDMLTGRKFGKTDEPQTRRFIAASRSIVVIDDAVEVESVAVNGVELSPERWDAFPLNADLDEQPFLWIEAEKSSFPQGRPGVEVTGTFGWPSVPSTVKDFTSILASKFLKRKREAPWGVVSAGGVDGLTVRLAKEDPDLMMLVYQLVRPETVTYG